MRKMFASTYFYLFRLNTEMKIKVNLRITMPNAIDSFSIQCSLLLSINKKICLEIERLDELYLLDGCLILFCFLPNCFKFFSRFFVVVACCFDSISSIIHSNSKSSSKTIFMLLCHYIYTSTIRRKLLPF